MERAQAHMLLDALLDAGQRLRNRVPPEAGGHFKAAGREALLGVRSLIDAALAGMDRPGTHAEGPKNIPVE